MPLLTKKSPGRVIARTDSRPGSGGYSHAPFQRTVRPEGQPVYTLSLALGGPPLLLSDDEFAAVKADVESGRVAVLEVSPQHRSALLQEFVDNAQAAEIAKLRATVARMAEALRSALVPGAQVDALIAGPAA